MYEHNYLNAFVNFLHTGHSFHPMDYSTENRKRYPCCFKILTQVLLFVTPRIRRENWLRDLFFRWVERYRLIEPSVNISTEAHHRNTSKWIPNRFQTTLNSTWLHENPRNALSIIQGGEIQSEVDSTNMVLWTLKRPKKSWIWKFTYLILGLVTSPYKSEACIEISEFMDIVLLR
jgi:hypothetical protein